MSFDLEAFQLHEVVVMDGYILVDSNHGMTFAFQLQKVVVIDGYTQTMVSLLIRKHFNCT